MPGLARERVYILRNWWRRRELNPRPHKRHNGIYARIPQLRFAMPPAHGQASGTAINLLILAPAPGCPARVASLLMTPDPPRRRKRSNVAELSREGQFVVGFCVFSRMFYEANRGPRRATEASTGTSKPVAPLKLNLHHAGGYCKRFNRPRRSS